jgi:crotonobetainyl-CoA:carnitine CoA-transferase CaiB-like acyl-CoA transferase
VSGPLAGIEVVDLTQALAGPYCAMMLADLGAHVIKVEPFEGDHARQQQPFMPDDAARHYGGYFGSVNRNKESLALDLKHPAALEVMERLVRRADVVIENFRVGVMERLGLGYERLQQINPRLVYGCIRGFGDPRTGASPYAHWPAFDIVAQAMGGIMGITGPDAEHPVKIGPGVGDIFPASLLAFGIVSAVRHAERTGEGQFVDVGMYDGILALCERIVYQHAYTGQVPRPQGNTHPLLVPFDIFPTRDGWVTIAAPRDQQWAELARIIGRAELAEHPEFKANNARISRAAEVRQMIAEWTSARSNAEVMAALGGRVPAGPVQSAADIAADPHVAARNMHVSLEHPGSAGRGTYAGTPVKFTRTRPAAAQRAPMLGEHTEQVLQQLGYSPAEQAELLANHVVQNCRSPP